MLDELANDLVRKADRTFADHRRRFILGIAGIGGSGKSTLAEKLQARIDSLTASVPRFACVLPLDGFHFTNDRLDDLGLRDRKGAPETFDAEKYIRLLHCLRSTPAAITRYPVYSRQLHEPVYRDDDTYAALSTTRLIITEGNYLLLDAPPWNALAEVLDECWLLHTAISRAKEWIIERHRRGGRSSEDALRHYERVDLKNAQLVSEKMRKPDRVLRWA
jgi:pantothenate kinase